MSYPARSNYWLTSRSPPVTIFLYCSALTSLTFSSIALTAKSHLGTIRSAIGGRTSSSCSPWKYCDPWRDRKNRWHATGIHSYSPSFNCARRSCCRFVGRPFRPYNDILWACPKCLRIIFSLQHTNWQFIGSLRYNNPSRRNFNNAIGRLTGVKASNCDSPWYNLSQPCIATSIWSTIFFGKRYSLL